MNYFSLIDLFNIIVAVYLGVLVYLNDSTDRLNRVFVLNTFLAAYTAFFEFLRLTAFNGEWAIVWHRLSFLWPFFPAAYLEFVLILTKNNYKPNNFLRTIVILPPVIFSVLHSTTNVLYEDLVKHWYGWEFTISENLVSGIIPLYFAVIGIISIIIIIRYYSRQFEKTNKKRALFALLGLSIPTLTGFVSKGFLPQLGINLPPLISISFLIGTIFLAVSILKYKFSLADPSKTIKEMLDTVGDYLIIFDTNGKLYKTSKSFLESLHYSEKEITEASIEKFIEFASSEFSNIISQPGKEFEIFLIASDNEKIPISAKVSQIHNSFYSENLYLLLGRDLRERKQFENELLAAKSDLESQVEVRTANLTNVNKQLFNEIELRKETEEKILHTLTERETLLKEIHHRVKNNLQIISSLLSLQRNSIKDKSIAGLFKESQNRIKTMALVHERLYQSDDFSKINLHDFLLKLSHDIYNSYVENGDSVKIEFDIDEVFLPLDYAIPIGLIANELLTNSFKYAFTSQSSLTKMEENIVWISYKLLGNNIYEFSVIDNGKGFPGDYDIKMNNSLGLKLVNSLVQQIDGKLEFSFEDKTRFRITFEDKITQK